MPTHQHQNQNTLASDYLFISGHKSHFPTLNALTLPVRKCLADFAELYGTLYKYNRRRAEEKEPPPAVVDSRFRFFLRYEIGTDRERFGSIHSVCQSIHRSSISCLPFCCDHRSSL
ncbi:hypothetical protein LXL04_022213 [Taraxacum kok-saghyz]